MDEQHSLLGHQERWVMLSRAYHRGVTLIELMIGIVIVGLLLALAAPSYISWLHSSQIRTAAESIISGIQLTRAEAVRRNASVQFRLTALPTSSWTVSVPSTAEVVQSRSGGEGSATASVATNGLSAATTVTFSGLGRVVANSGASATLTQADITSTVTSSATRALSIRVGGGVVRMCDAALPASDPQSCSF